jgi:hypothetical protein
MPLPSKPPSNLILIQLIFPLIRLVPGASSTGLSWSNPKIALLPLSVAQEIDVAIPKYLFIYV